MTNLLDDLVRTARETIASGYYGKRGTMKKAPSLVEAIRRSRTERAPAVIAEIKPATPTRGKLVEGGAKGLMAQFVADGACGLSVLTEPKHFHGNLGNLRHAVGTGVPVLMKDFVLDEKQIDCAAAYGASAVLLIASIVPPERLQALVEYARLAEREVLVECASRAEVELALETDAELVGVNNRDLRTFALDLDRTKVFTTGLKLGRPLVSLSGFHGPKDVDKVRGTADAILVGTSLIEGRTTIPELIQ